MPRQLAYRGGFAGAVDTGDHDHGGLVLAYHQRLFQRLEQQRQRLDQRILDRHGMRHAAVLDAALDIGQQVFGRLHAGVGHQQRGFQVFVERVVNATAGKNAGNAGAGIAQAGLQFAQPALALGRRLARCHGLGNGNRRDQRAANQAAAMAWFSWGNQRADWRRDRCGLSCRCRRRCRRWRRRGGFFFEETEHWVCLWSHPIL